MTSNEAHAFRLRRIREINALALCLHGEAVTLKQRNPKEAARRFRRLKALHRQYRRLIHENEE